MSEKRYCFIPETYKVISVYNPGNIISLEALDNKNINPTVTFKYCIDDYDKVKMFFLNGQPEEGATDDIEYFKYKTIQSIKSIFRVAEIYDYVLVTEDKDSRFEFTVFYDANGTHIHTKDLVTKNKFNTILAHRYTYNFYKRYDVK